MRVYLLNVKLSMRFFKFPARPVSGLILFHQLRVEGFIVLRWSYEEWSAVFKEMAQWIQEVCVVIKTLELHAR